MLSRQSHSSSTVRLAVLTPLTATHNSSSPSPPSSGSSQAGTPESDTQPLTVRPRLRSRTNSETSRVRQGHNRTRSHSGSMPFNPNYPSMQAQAQASSSSSALSARLTLGPPRRTPGSPPPYSPEPPEVGPNSPFLAKRAASTPHLHSPPMSPAALHVYPHSHGNSRRPSSTALYSHSPSALRPRAPPAQEETDDDTDGCTSGDDAVVYRSTQATLAGSLRERLFGKGKGRADNHERVRLISTAPGVLGAGETETESEDAVSNISSIVLQVIYHM